MAFFDARTVEPDAGRVGPVAAGWYSLVGSKMDVLPTQDTLGLKMNAQFEIFDGPFKGRKVFHNFNLKNNSEQAQLIGQKQLSAFCHAVRVLVPEVPEQLNGIPFKAKLKVTPADGQYEAKNEITAFRDFNDATAVDIGGPAAAQAIKAVAPIAPPAPQQAWGQPPAAAQVAPPPVAAVAPPAMAAQPQFAAPAAAAPQQFAAAPQPWAQPAAPAAAAPAAVAPVQAAPAAVAPAAQPAWAAAPAEAAPVSQAQVQAQAAVAQVAVGQVDPAGLAVPPWMQQPAA